MSMTQFNGIAECFSVLVNKASKGDEQSRKELLKVFSKEEVEKLISIYLKEDKQWKIKHS